MTRDEYVASIKAAFVTIGTQTALKGLFATFPFLNWPIIKPITTYFVDTVLILMTDGAEMQAFFTFVDMRVGKQAKGFEAAAFANYVAQQTGTKEEKYAAALKLKQEFANFISLKS